MEHAKQEMTLNGIQDKIKEGQYRFSDHAVKRMIRRSISRQDVETVICEGEIIEEYPLDKFSPSCLVYGKTEMGRNLHIQISLPRLWLSLRRMNQTGGMD